MKISFNPQVTYNYNNKQNPKKASHPNFTSYNIPDTVNKHCTNFVRSDLKWSEFMSLIGEKYKNTNRVQSYVWELLMAQKHILI